eukprot:jgi/Tetstr1/436047/TSEL_024926.t1
MWDTKSTGKSPRSCIVPGCLVSLAGADAYTSRTRTCAGHRRAESARLASGVVSRFCQQCSKFHSVIEFLGTKRGCMKKLAEHNLRQQSRRRAQGESSPKSPRVGAVIRRKKKELVDGPERELLSLVQLLQQGPKQRHQQASASSGEASPLADDAHQAPPDSPGRSDFPRRLQKDPPISRWHHRTVLEVTRPSCRHVGSIMTANAMFITDTRTPLMEVASGKPCRILRSSTHPAQMRRVLRLTTAARTTSGEAPATLFGT